MEQQRSHEQLKAERQDWPAPSRRHLRPARRRAAITTMVTTRLRTLTNPGNVIWYQTRIDWVVAGAAGAVLAFIDGLFLFR